MASAKEIALLERKLKDAKSNREKIVLAKELKELKSKLTTTQKTQSLPTQRRKIRMLSSAEFSELIARLKDKPEYSFLKSMGKKKIEDDFRVVAKPVGWRIKGKDNYKVPSKKFRKENPDLVYYEARPRHSDVHRPNRLEQGGNLKTIKDGADTWYLTYADSTHFFLSNTKDFKGSPYHIGQFYGRPFYNEVDEWLKSETRKKSGFKSDGGMMAKGGSVKTMGITFKNTFGIDKKTFEKAIFSYYDTASSDQVERISARSFLRKLQQELGDEKNKEVMSYIQRTFADNEIYATGGSLKKKDNENTYIWKINQDIESRSGNNEPTFEVGKIKGYANALKTRDALQEGVPDNFKYSIKPTNKYARGGGVKKKDDVAPKRSVLDNYNVQLLESQKEDDKGSYYMFPNPADKNSSGFKFAKGGNVTNELNYLWRWSGGLSVNEIIEIIDALNDAGITDEDLKIKKPKKLGGSRYQELKDKKAPQIWQKAKPFYKGNLEGNWYFQVVTDLIDLSMQGKTILEDWKINPIYSGVNQNVRFKKPFKFNEDWRFDKGGEIEENARFKADNPNWTNEKLLAEYETNSVALSNFNKGFLKPKQVVGGGYKSSAIAKKVAKRWLENKVAEYKMALEIRGVMAKGGMTKKEFQAKKMGKVMHEFKQGDLHSGRSGNIVKNREQAIAIGLSEAKRGWKNRK